MTQAAKAKKIVLNCEEITLEFPVLDGGEEVKVLQIRRPKARDLLVMDSHEGNIARTIALISQLTDRPEEVIFELEAVDFNKASDLVTDFLG